MNNANDYTNDRTDPKVLRYAALQTMGQVNTALDTLGKTLARDRHGFMVALEQSEMMEACRPELLPPGWGRMVERLREIHRLTGEVVEALEN